MHPGQLQISVTLKIFVAQGSKRKFEVISGRFCKDFGWNKPRTYHQEARKNFFAFAKKEKEQIKNQKNHPQLGYVMLNIRYINGYPDASNSFNKKGKNSAGNNQVAACTTRLYVLEPYPLSRELEL